MTKQEKINKILMPNKIHYFEAKQVYKMGDV